MLLLSLSLVVSTVTACRPQSNPDANWVVATGTVEEVKGVSPQDTSQASTAKPLYNRVAFQYDFEKKSYKSTQLVSINVPMRFESGQSIQIKVNKQKPDQARIELPPEPPDRTGMKWHRVQESTAEP